MVVGGCSAVLTGRAGSSRPVGVDTGSDVFMGAGVVSVSRVWWVVGCCVVVVCCVTRQKKAELCRLDLEKGGTQAPTVL